MNAGSTMESVFSTSVTPREILFLGTSKKSSPYALDSVEVRNKEVMVNKKETGSNDEVAVRANPLDEYLLYTHESSS